MKKFLEKLYEDFPELKNDREKVDKLVYFLYENKPIIEVSKDFKYSLKNRLDSYIWLKQKKKNNFLIFALPVFSFCFVIAWFLYYYQWLEKIDDKNLVSITTFDDKNDFHENAQLTRMMSFDFVEDEELVESIMLDWNFETEYIEETKLEIKSEQKIETEKVEVSKDNNFSENEELKIDELRKEEVIIDENIYNEYERNDYKSNNEKEIAYSEWDDDFSWDEGVMMIAMFMDSSFYEELSFKDYCDENFWEFIEYENENNEKLFKCVIEKKVCFEEKYENWYCEFEKDE